MSLTLLFLPRGGAPPKEDIIKLAGGTVSLDYNYPVQGTDVVRVMVGTNKVGLILITATDDADGAIRMKLDGTVYALKRLN